MSSSSRRLSKRQQRDYEALRRVIKVMKAEKDRWNGGESLEDILPLNMVGDLTRVWMNPETRGYVHGYLQQEPYGAKREDWDFVAR